MRSDHLQTSQYAVVVGVDQTGTGAGGWLLMAAVPLVVALAVAAGIAVIIGVFVAGSLERRKVYWSICLVTMGVIVLALLLALSANTNLDDPNKILSINPLRAGKEVWRNRDYVPVIKGLLLGGLVPIVALILIPLATRRNPSWRLPSLTAFTSLLLGGLFIAAAFANSTSVVPSHDLSDVILVPDRFVVRAYLPNGLFSPTSIAFDSEDRLYVASLAGDVNVVVDTDGDGVGDQVNLFTHKEGLALGLAISDDDRTVYISGGGEVDRVKDLDGDGKGDVTQRIVQDLPSMIFSPHSNNGIALGPDGRLYMTVGSNSNSGPAIKPFGGTILVSQTDGSDLQIYASGLRNPYDLAFTSDGILLASDNAPDGVDSLPPAELNVIEQGKNYGFPDFFGQPPVWSDTIGPVVEYRDSAVPTGLVAYKGAEFPAAFKDLIFLTLWGPPGGSKVVVVDLMETESGEYRAVSNDFAQGFVSAIDVTVDSKGRLYVADHGGNQVYQISARGGGN